MIRYAILATALSAFPAYAQSVPVPSRDLDYVANMILSCPAVYEIAGRPHLIDAAKEAATFYVEESNISRLYETDMDITDFEEWFRLYGGTVMLGLREQLNTGGITDAGFFQLIEDCDEALAHFEFDIMGRH